MKKSFSFWSRIKRYVIVQYLSGQISPIALLAIKNGLKFEGKSPYNEMNIYSDSKGNRYINTPLGFSSVERYNLSLQLRELQADYEILLSENDNLERKAKKIELKYQNLQEQMELLKNKKEKQKNTKGIDGNEILVLGQEGLKNSSKN